MEASADLRVFLTHSYTHSVTVTLRTILYGTLDPVELLQHHPFQSTTINSIVDTSQPTKQYIMSETPHSAIHATQYEDVDPQKDKAKGGMVSQKKR